MTLTPESLNPVLYKNLLGAALLAAGLGIVATSNRRHGSAVTKHRRSDVAKTMETVIALSLLLIGSDLIRH